MRGIRRDARGNDEYRLDEHRGIGYLHVVHMTSDTLPRVEEVLQKMARSGLGALVLDLRECVGGYLEAGVGVADLFLERGRILTVTSRSAAPRAYDAQPGVATRMPLAVLINQETASACEILAAALQDHDRAALVGQRTFGKGYVGNLFPLGEHQGGLKITVASFQRPSGTTLDRHEAPAGSTDPGVAPDPGLEVVVEGEEYDAWFADFILLDSPIAPAHGPAKDRLLDRAVGVLIERMGAVAGGAN